MFMFWPTRCTPRCPYIENAKSFISELGNPYDHILLDKKGFISIDIGAYGVPETYVIDNTNNKIIKKYLGPIDEFILEEIINILNSWKKFLH